MKTAIDLFYNKDDKKYYLVQVDYDLETGDSKVQPLKELADNLAVALFKLDEILGKRQQQIMKEREQLENQSTTKKMAGPPLVKK